MSAREVYVPVPVYRPSEEEFADFAAYLRQIVPVCLGAGLVKVIPPPSWHARQTPYADAQKTLLITSPIRQCCEGNHGVYEFKHITTKTMKYARFAAAVERENRPPPTASLAEVEDLFWKTIRFREPLYGSDVQLSLFEDCAGTWDLRRLPSILSVVGAMPGVTVPYVYVGSWKSAFCWHVEDVDLFSINYHHWGAPKSWYGIPTSEGHLLEALAKRHFPEFASQCPSFLRHKTVLITPANVARTGATIVRAVQNPGEFIITLPGAYHAGFNHGLNCAEAVNFATPEWIPIGKAARPCRCFSDTVRIDVHGFEGYVRYVGSTHNLLAEPDAVHSFPHEFALPLARFVADAALRKRVLERFGASAAEIAAADADAKRQAEERALALAEAAASLAAAEAQQVADAAVAAGASADYVFAEDAQRVVGCAPDAADGALMCESLPPASQGVKRSAGDSDESDGEFVVRFEASGDGDDEHVSVGWGGAAAAVGAALPPESKRMHAGGL